MTSYAWAVPGAKAICVKSTWTRKAANGVVLPPNAPMLHDILTIREIISDVHVSGGAALSFIEICPDNFFAVAAFRPLVTRTIEDDIAIFAPWLNTREVAQ